MLFVAVLKVVRRLIKVRTYNLPCPQAALEGLSVFVDLPLEIFIAGREAVKFNETSIY